MPRKYFNNQEEDIPSAELITFASKQCKHYMYTHPNKQPTKSGLLITSCALGGSSSYYTHNRMKPHWKQQLVSIIYCLIMNTT